MSRNVYDIGMSNISALFANLNKLQAALDLEVFCECECCGNGPIDWALVRELEGKIAQTEEDIAREQALEDEALRFEELELAA